VLVLRRFGVGPWSYYHNRLFDPAISMTEKASYLGKPGAGNALERLTPLSYQLLYSNKLIADRFFGALGFPLPKIYGVLNPEVGHTSDGQPLRTALDLDLWLERFQGPGFVFKPLEGAYGYKILVLARGANERRNVFITPSGDEYDAEQLVAFTRQDARLPTWSRQLHSFVLQERLFPHPAIRELVGGPTVCTVRLVTFIALDGQPRVLGAAFKLQSGPVGADNFALGSIACFVDVDTGILGRGRTHDDLRDFTVVPGTDRSFVGFRLPHWAEVRAMALRAATAFPWARAVAWDIALTDRGVMLLEGNERWDPDLIQFPADRGLMAGEFKALCEALGDRA
jgi:hypothetical protein